jgi:molybdopterin synthase sulfur carrier subunit
MMTVLFFAQLREQLKTDNCEISITLPCTINDIQSALIKLNPSWAQFLQERTLLNAVNQTMVEGDFVVGKGDEVAFFPPVTGG